MRATRRSPRWRVAQSSQPTSRSSCPARCHPPRSRRRTGRRSSRSGIIEPTDAIVRTVAACVCGSDLWPYRGINEVRNPRPIGHEYCGIVEQVGDQVSTITPGQFVVGGFLTSDNTCPHSRAGFQSACQNGGGYDGCQAELMRVPLADGTLVATPELPPDDLIPSLLSLSDVLAASARSAGPGLEPPHRPRPGLRPRTPARTDPRCVSGHGPAGRDQSAAPALTRRGSRPTVARGTTGREDR